MNPDALLLTHAAATLSMVGLIWFVQLVHYPMFAAVGRGAFSSYEQEHQQRTTWLVTPLMLAELLTALLLLSAGLQGADRMAAWIGLALLLVIWTSTAVLQVPLHQKLTSGFDRVSAETRFFRSSSSRAIDSSASRPANSWFRSFGNPRS